MKSLGDFQISGSKALGPSTSYRYGGNILCKNGNVEIEDRSEELRSAFEAMLSAPARA